MLIQETYVDVTKGCQFGESELYEAFTDDTGKLFRFLQKEYGRCTGHVFIDTQEGTEKIGWVFEKVMPYEDARSKADTYTREVWVTLYDKQPEVKTTRFHHTLKD